MLDAHARAQAPHQIGEHRAGPGVHAQGVGQRDLRAEGQVRATGGRGALLGGGLAGQGALHQGRVGGRRELLDQRVVGEHAGQAAQDVEVLVAGRRDAHHEADGLAALAPGDALRELQHGDTGLADEVAGVGRAVRDGDAAAQVGVRLTFTGEHAAQVGGVDVPGAGQQRGDLFDGGLFAAGLRAEADQ